MNLIEVLLALSLLMSLAAFIYPAQWRALHASIRTLQQQQFILRMDVLMQILQTDPTQSYSDTIDQWQRHNKMLDVVASVAYECADVANCNFLFTDVLDGHHYVYQKNSRL